MRNGEVDLAAEQGVTSPLRSGAVTCGGAVTDPPMMNFCFKSSQVRAYSLRLQETGRRLRAKWIMASSRFCKLIATDYNILQYRDYELGN